jgi:hypothetical protein
VDTVGGATVVSFRDERIINDDAIDDQLHRPKGAPPMFEIFTEEQEALDSFAGAARASGRRAREPSRSAGGDHSMTRSWKKVGWAVGAVALRPRFRRPPPNRT